MSLDNMFHGGIKMCVYGRSGTGKTTFWGSFPGRILALMCSGSDPSGELRSINTPEHRKKIDAVLIKSPSDMVDAVAYLKDNHGLYSTVVVDHITELQRMILSGILNVPDLPEILTWGTATRDQWGQCSSQTVELLKIILGLETNVVLVAQEREFDPTQDSTGILVPYVAAAMTPAATGWLNPAVDYIVQTCIRKQKIARKTKIAGKETTVFEETGVMEYGLRVGPHDVYVTKFRLPMVGKSLPDVIVNPTYQKVKALIDGQGS